VAVVAKSAAMAGCLYEVGSAQSNRQKFHPNDACPVLTPMVKNLTLRLMGDKSPKATHKQAAQKQKASAAKKKTNAPSAKPVPKPK
jgi:hypothetical protein